MGIKQFFCVCFSRLADADHTDTSVNYGHDEADDTAVTLRAEKRSVALDQYVAGLGNANDARSRLRRNTYTSCRNAKSSVDLQLVIVLLDREKQLQ